MGNKNKLAMWNLFEWLFEKSVSNSEVATPMGIRVADIVLEDFAKPKQRWVNKNDTVMGGASSSGAWTITGGYGILSGEVVGIPFLGGAPGFIKSESKSTTK